MLTFDRVRNKPTVLQQLTGLNPEVFGDLLPAFLEALAYHNQLADAQRPTPRKRQPGGGRKPLLRDPADRLLFILFYFRIYPVQRVQAFFFGMSQTQACDWVHRITPVVNRALGAEQHLPERRPARLVSILRQCPGLEFIIDGTERPNQRPKDKDRQQQYYSGKKKRHTVKNVVVVEKRTRRIRMLSRTTEGKRSDKRIAEDEDYRFPKDSRLWYDLGFQGYRPRGAIPIHPIKKPRNGELTPGQKHHNRAIAHGRVRVEHAIGGVKVFHITPSTSGTGRGCKALLIVTLHQFAQIEGPHVCPVLFNVGYTLFLCT
ncbi:MAG: hypothetical protein RLZZ387_1964 [Chloroflexota bacterium]|jgi:hypothetical protein